jgi:hypothetical protein
VKEADPQNDANPGASEPAGTSERRRPSRLLVVTAALALGAVVSGVAVLSRADTSVRVPDLIGQPADPVGDNLAFAAETAGLAADVVDVTDCLVRDANIVVKQTPAPGTRVSAGTPVTVYICRTPDPKPLGDVSPSSNGAPILLGNLPEAGVVVGSGHRVTFVDLEGTTDAILRGFEVAGNPGSPGVWLRQHRNYFLLDVDQGALVPRPASEARMVIYDEGREPQLASPPTQRHRNGEPLGHWRYAYRSSSGVTLAQWSGECEVPTAYWIDESGTARIVTGERSVTHAPESLALGWSPDQRAVLLLPQGTCGGGANPPGIYLYSAPGVGRLIFETQPASSADMWYRLN